MNKRCKFGENCWNIAKCRYHHSPHKNIALHLIKCKFGYKCIYQASCRFYHSPEKLQNQQRSQFDFIKNQTVSQNIQNMSQNPAINNTQIINQKNSQHDLVQVATQQQSEFKTSVGKSDKAIEFFQIFVAQQQYLQQKLQQFLNPRLLKTNSFEIIRDYLTENSDPNDAELVFQIIEKIQQQIPTAIFDFGYVKLVKTIVRKKYNFQSVLQQLKKQKQIRQKKNEKQLQILSKFPMLLNYNVLEDSQLIQLNSQKCLFLIDGNNVLPTQKIFRKYFQSSSQKIKSEGQIRLQWLIAELPNCILFFDYKYDQQYYQQIKKRIIYPEQLQSIDKHKILFANKQKNEDADQLILLALEQNSHHQSMVLITGDRVLIQKGLRVKNEGLKVSSGLFFIKFCKQFIRRKYFGNKIKKGVIKRIFVQPIQKKIDRSEQSHPE